MNIRKILIILALATGLALFFLLDLQRFFSLEALRANRRALQEFHASNPVAMAAGFMLVYIIQTALSLPGATIMSLAAGAIFGTLLGSLYAIGAASIGATLAFLATRYLLRDVVLDRFGTRLEGINRELEDRGLNYLLFLRLVPLFPFFLINLAAGLTRLPLRTFFIGTLLGIIPGGIVYVNAGASLATIDSMAQVASPRVVISFALLGLMALAPPLYKKYRATGK